MHAELQQQPEPWRRAQTFLRTLYEPKTTVYPVDQPLYTGEDHWWHFVMPFRETEALRDSIVRDAVTRAAQLAIARLESSDLPLMVRGVRVDPSYVEFLSHGHYQHRRRLKARLGRAMALAYRRSTGSKLHWEWPWAAMLTNQDEMARCCTHLGLPTMNVVRAQTREQSYDAFMAGVFGM